MASLLQAMISGIPILFVVREQPQAYYLVLCFMIFVICAVVLLVIFVPKMVLVEKFSNESPAEQKKRIMSSIRQSRASITQGRKTNSNNNNNNSNNKGSGVSFASDISGNLHGSSRVFDTDPETAPSTPVLQKKSITSKTTVTGGSNSTTTRKDVLRSNTTNEKEKPLSIFEDFKSEIEDNKNDNYKGGDEEEKREEDDKSVETSNNCNHLNETENNGEQRQIRIAEASEVDSDDQSQVRFSRD